MQALAWIGLILAGILTLSASLVLIDLVATELSGGDIYAYEDMALALVVGGGSAHVTTWSFRRVRSRRD